MLAAGWQDAAVVVLASAAVAFATWLRRRHGATHDCARCQGREQGRPNG
jgi:hypothetical protein